MEVSKISPGMPTPYLSGDLPSRMSLSLTSVLLHCGGILKDLLPDLELGWINWPYWTDFLYILYGVVDYFYDIVFLICVIL